MNLNNLKEKMLKLGEKIGLQVHEEDAAGDALALLGRQIGSGDVTCYM